jgi:hypothetical protein
MAQYICEKCIRDNFCNDCKTRSGNRKNVEDCGDYIQRLSTRQKIRISGYYLDDKSEFFKYVCVVNDLGIRKDDEEIFFYFNHWGEVDRCQNKNNGGEFVITDITEY